MHIKGVLPRSETDIVNGKLPLEINDVFSSFGINLKCVVNSHKIKTEFSEKNIFEHSNNFNDDLTKIEPLDYLSDSEEKIQEIIKKVENDQNSLPLNICVDCGKIFENPKELKNHYKAIHGLNNRNTTLNNELKSKNKCNVCNKFYKSKQALVRHKCSLNSRKFKEEFQKTEFVCEDCGKIYRHRKDLKIHRDAAHGPSQQWPCEHCNKVFTTKLRLYRQDELSLRHFY